MNIMLLVLVYVDSWIRFIVLFLDVFLGMKMIQFDRQFIFLYYSDMVCFKVVYVKCCYFGLVGYFCW